MTRAKDISKIITDADFSGTLDVTGTITVGDGHTIGDDANDNLEIATSLGENLVLKSSGNVLTYLDTNEDQSTAAYQIYGDVTSPRSLLRVEETGDISFYEDTGTTPKLFWDASTERLGIGTSSPINNLHILGSSGLRIVNSDDTSNLSILGFDNNESPSLNLYSNNSVTARVHSEGDSYFNGGNVGIGTSSPNEKLTVNSGAISFLGDISTPSIGAGLFRPANNTLAVVTGSTERMRITSAGNVGIGTSSPDTNLDVEGAGDCTISITAGSTSHDSKIDFVHGSTIDGGITYDHNGSYASEKMAFRAGNNGTHMYLMGDGNFFLGKTNTSSSVEGVRLHSGVNHHITVNAASVILFNRGTNDGQIVGIAQADSTEGNISVSGNTVSYNAFSASHWSRLNDNSKPTILKGTVIETIDEMMDWYQLTFTVPASGDTPEHSPKISIALEDGQSVGDTITYNHDGTDYQATIIQEGDNKHTKCKISDTADSTRVYGVFADWDNDDDTVNDMYVTAVGTHVVRVHSNATVSAGDLLTSNGDGTAKVQDDDIIRSKTIGKVLTNIVQETYDDGSYTVPCALYCG